MNTLLVIPCYNEAARLEGEKFLNYAIEHSDVDFLFVNDGSKDNTVDVLNALTKQHPQLHLLDLKTNCGKAEAVRQGILFAVENFNFQYAGFWDADLATPLSEIENFVALMKSGDYDAVTGLRLARLGANVKRRKMRHYMGRVFATAAAEILNIEVYDTQCGAKLFKADKLNIFFGEPFVSRWFFDIELFGRLIKQIGRTAAKSKIYEYPLLHWEDVQGSQLKISDFIKTPLELLKIKRHYF